MSIARETIPAPPLPVEPRHALIIATTEYADASLRQLRSPARDATDFAAVLADPRIGGFEVTTVLQESAHHIRVALESFLTERRPDDLALIYVSCHGLVDARRRLYFSGTDTHRRRLAATGVESRWLLEQMEDCRARRQVLILDCCFSGAFALNAKGDDDLGIGDRFGGHSRGRVVLTASRATEYSFEGEPVAGRPAPSVFTAALLDGITTGAADANNDGWIDVEEAYDYAFRKVREASGEQTPQRHVHGGEGMAIVLARSPAGLTVGAAPLPAALESALQNPYPDVRIGAAEMLGEWLHGDDPSKILAARRSLFRLAEADVPRVAAAARRILDGPRREETPAPHRPDPDPPADPLPERGPDESSDNELGDMLDELGYVSAPLPLRRVLSLSDEPSAGVARYLFATEKFRGEWRLHWIKLVKRTIYAAIALVLAWTQPGIARLHLDVDPADLRRGVTVVLGGAAAALLWSNVAWYFERFVITDKRIMLVTGLIVRRVAMMPLMRVTDMKYEQTVLGRMLGYGTFRVESAGRLNRMSQIRHMPDPNELYLRIVEEMYEPGAAQARMSETEAEDDENPP